MKKFTPTILKDAIEIIGGPLATANACNVSVQAVYKWLRTGRAPLGRCLVLEEATGKRINKYQLRPDVYGADPSNQGAK